MPFLYALPWRYTLIHLNRSKRGYQVAANLFDYYSGLADKIHGETSYPDSSGKYKVCHSSLSISNSLDEVQLTY